MKRKNAAGKRVYVVDVRVRNKHTKAVERYRRDAKVQTAAGAKDERHSILDLWFRTGSIASLLGPAAAAPTPSPGAVTWDTCLTRWREVKKKTLKHSTAVGYEELLASGHFAAWEGLLLPPSREFVDRWDVGLVGFSDSRRRNFHVIMRSVLGCVLSKKDLADLPPIPKVGRVEVQSAHPEDVAAILNESDDGIAPYFVKTRQAARVAFALAAYAGLRASEVRGLRWRDVDLRAGWITVREATVHGVPDAPKSGHERRIPIAPALRTLLKQGAPEAYVAAKANGDPWADAGILRALHRACERLGIPPGRVHALRHHFATSTGERTDVETLRQLLGHADVSTTGRYMHTSEDRKRDAILGNGGQRTATTS